MSMSPVLRSFRRLWTDESSPWALRSKQFVASVLPDRVLVGLKKRYYLSLLRADADELMETDARALPRFLKAGDFVIDVGAFVGFYSQRLSRLVGPAGLVWSFEPMPPTFEILSASVQRLGLTNVCAFPYAVSDRNGAATMEIPRFTGGGESWWDARIVDRGPREAFRRFDIATKTLDSLLAHTDRPVTFMKIDAEYHELHCIRGAVDSLRRWKPAIQVETLEDVDEPGSELNTLTSVLCGLGYSPYCFDGDRFHLRRHGERQQNLFFLCAHHGSAL
jgi:FkbM family methyltransferase